MLNKTPVTDNFPNRSEDFLLKLRDADVQSLTLKVITLLLAIIVTFAFLYAIVNKTGEPLFNFLGLMVTPILTAFAHSVGVTSGKKQGAMEEKLKVQSRNQN